MDMTGIKLNTDGMIANHQIKSIFDRWPKRGPYAEMSMMQMATNFGYLHEMGLKNDEIRIFTIISGLPPTEMLAVSRPNAIVESIVKQMVRMQRERR